MSWLSSSFRQVASAFAGFGKDVAQRLSLVPVYLGHLLWLLSPKFRDLAVEGYAGNAAVYAVLRVLSTAVPEPPLIAYTRLPDGTPGDPLDFSHPLRQLIHRPNALMTEFEFWEMTTLHCGIVGISHWWKERDNAGRILSLWPLRPDRVGPIYAKPDDDEQVLVGWSYQIPGTASYVPLPARDVITFNFPDPSGESGGMAEGLGPLQVLAAEVGADNEATRFVGSLVANYAMPGMVLQVQKGITTQEDGKLIKSAFMREFGGARRGEPIVVDQGATVTQTGFSLKDLEFPSLRRTSESRVAAAFGVPAILAGLLVGLEAGIRATIEEQRAYFAETTLSAYWRRYSDQFTVDIADEYGENLVCLFDTTTVRALAGQAALELQKIRDAYERGALTKNEYREALGFEKRADGDTYAYGIAPGRGVEVPTDAGDAEDSNPDAPDAAVEEDAAVPAAPPTEAATPSQKAARKPKRTATGSGIAAPVALAMGEHQMHSAFDTLMTSLEPARGA